MVTKVHSTNVIKPLRRREVQKKSGASKNGLAKQNGHMITDDPHLVDDPFYYGWRTVVIERPDGKKGTKRIPLKQSDFLDPQLGDQMVQSDVHFQRVKSLYDCYEKRYLDDTTTGVMSDVKMLWGIPGLTEPAPDLAVIPNMTTKDEQHSSFHVVKEGTRPCLVVEVVSPKYDGDDTTKVDVYEQAGIQEYIIYDPWAEDESEPAELIGYRMVNGIYDLIVPDAQGRLYSATTDVWFGLDADQRLLILTDGTTGERLLDNKSEHRRRIVAEQQLNEEAQRADEEAQRADEEAQRADEEAARANRAEAELARLRALMDSSGSATSAGS